MRALRIMLLCLALGGIYFYNTNWFQSFFLYDRFYEDIYNAPFDVTKVGESISIPLEYKYKTCYRLAVAISDKDIFHERRAGYGLLEYRFVSRNKVLAEGYTHVPTRHDLMLKQGITSINILVFHLPFPGASDDLTLHLEVREPFRELEQYAGNINCKINPDYSADLGICYNEDLMISY
jgi:hypothetical protein